MKWALIAIVSGWVGFFATGLIIGLCINRNDARRVPDHPTLRRTTQRRFHVIEGGNSPYNWAEEQ